MAKKFEYTREMLEENLYKVYDILEQRDIVLTPKSYNQVRRERPHENIPASSTFVKRYGYWDDVLDEFGLYEKVQQLKDRILKKHLQVAYAELSRRGKPFTSTTYSELVKEDSFKHMPSVSTYSSKYHGFNKAIKLAELNPVN
ncbi:hypothetical protein U8V72_25775 [Priestia filamentosa]|uniref:hypothetical protein n=1 Tax=Priestia filamentosa TaxID=1402861 RepID=UPI00058903D5